MRDEWPVIDVSVVTYENARWIENFIRSLQDQHYPLESIRLLVCDHSEGEGVIRAWETAVEIAKGRFAEVVVTQKPNRGFGAGHNTNLGHSTSAFFMVANIDLTFFPETLTNLVATALGDHPEAAAWECRQVPDEHPKYYDPKTLETQWCSAAACLYRAEAIKATEGFDENVFMYGEDVELSFALRARGFGLRYVPSATVNHFSYDDRTKLTGKPHQIFGTAFSYVYIARSYVGFLSSLKFSLAILASALLSNFSWEQTGKKARGVCQAMRTSSPRPKRLKDFRPYLAGLQYEIERTPPWISAPTVHPCLGPTVSIIVRTMASRLEWAREALRTISYQTYRRLDVVLVEDGSDVADGIVDELAGQGINVRHLSIARSGRCVAGNVGLVHAKGDLLMFLDDDDGLFADHVETLVALATEHPDAPVVYSEAIRVFTRTTSLRPLAYEEMSFAPGHGNGTAFDRTIMLKRNLIPIQAALFRRAVYEAHGGLDESLDYLEDWDLWLRFMQSGDFRKSPRITSYYRVPDDLAVLKQRIARHRRNTAPTRLLPP